MKSTKKSRKNSNRAKKANQTRAARRAFEQRYRNTCLIARDILRGDDSDDIAERHCVYPETVWAVRANLNRPGLYQEMADACRY